MKKSILIGACLALAISFVFSACSGIGGKDNSSASEQKEATYYKLTGNIKLNGAVPSAAAKSNNSRSATSSLDVSKITFTKDDFDIYASRTKNVSAADGGDGPGYKNPTININDWTYSIEVNDYATFDVYCYLWGYTFYGKSTFDFTEDMANAGTAPDIVLSPHSYESEKEGSVKLEFTDVSGKIKSVSYKGDVLGFYDAQNNSFEIGSSADFTSGKATVELENVHPNSYEVTFTFTDDVDGKGNTLYECKEAVAVFGGFTTDTWLGEGAHLVKNSSGKVEFKITDDLISQYGTECVPDTKIALYTETVSDSNTYLNFYLSDSVNSIPSTATYPSLSPQSNSFCFDNDGNLYILLVDINSYDTSIISNKSGFTEKQLTNSLFTGYGGCGLMVDRATNIMYGYGINEMTLKVYKYPKLISNGTLDGEVEYICSIQIDDNNNANHQICCINNGIVYDYCTFTDGDIHNEYFAELDLSSAVENRIDEYTVENRVDIDKRTTSDNPQLLSLSINGDFSITDMIYQDGSVYMLVNQFDLEVNEWTDKNIFSRGCVVKYNLWNKQLKKVGMSENEMNPEKMYIVGVTPNGENVRPYNAADNPQYLTVQKSENGLGENVPNAIYSPESLNGLLSTTEFYGPKKFIAIKPKKLIISDNGLAFYTDAAGCYRYKNVNRVVTVDLEKFAVSEVNEISSEKEITFDFDKTGDFTVGDYNNEGIGATIYNKNGENKDFSGNYYAGFYSAE